jgi:hypothetical protein
MFRRGDGTRRREHDDSWLEERRDRLAGRDELESLDNSEEEKAAGDHTSATVQFSIAGAPKREPAFATEILPARPQLFNS